MADARDRRNGIRRLRLIFPVDVYRDVKKQGKALQAVLGTTDLETTVAAVIEQAHDRLK